MTIWKYTLNEDSITTIEAPANARVLYVGTQKSRGGVDCIRIWLLCDPAEPLTNRPFEVAGTGQNLHPSVDADKYVGTTFTNNRAYVWHVFDINPPAAK